MAGGGGIGEVSLILRSPHGRALLIESLAFMLLFTAWNGIQNILSSISLGIQGDVSFFVMYLAYASSSLIAPPVADRVSAKVVMSVCAFWYMLYMFTGIFAGETILHWLVLIFVSTTRGGSGAFLWTAQGRYTSLLAAHFSAENNRPLRATMGTFSGIFFGFFYVTHFAGNMLDSILVADEESSPRALYITMVTISLFGLALFLFLPIQKAVRKASSSSSLSADSSDSSASDEEEGARATVGVEKMAVRQKDLGALTDEDVYDQAEETALDMRGQLSGDDEEGYSDEDDVQTESADVRPPMVSAMMQSAVEVSLKPFRSHLLALQVPLFVLIGLAIPICYDFFPRIIGSTVGKHYIGYVMAVFGLTGALLSSVVGRIADYSLWPVMLLLLLPFAICSAVLGSIYALDAPAATGMSVGVAPMLLQLNPWLVVLCSFLIGVGLSAAFCLNSTLLANLFTEELSVVFACFNFYETLAATLAFVILPLLPIWAIYLIFLLATLLTAACLARLIFLKSQLHLVALRV